MLKLISVEVATLILAFTFLWTVKEDGETGCINLPAVRQIKIVEESTDDETGAEIILSYEPVEDKVNTEPVINLDVEDEEILLKITMAEAEGESTEGKALVMLTVLNRVSSDEFPDTIHEVVFQERQYSPVLDGRYDAAIPNDDCYEALELVKYGWDKSQGAMYFENYGADCWHSRNLEFLYQSGNHNFYR